MIRSLQGKSSTTSLTIPHGECSSDDIGLDYSVSLWRRGSRATLSTLHEFNWPPPRLRNPIQICLSANMLGDLNPIDL